METGPHTVLFSHTEESPRELAVCISLYNYADFIVEALDSVQQQTLDRFDLTIVDDGSTDGSASVARNWLQENTGRFGTVQLVQHLQNRGLPITRNTAIALSDAEYCFILDADNQLYPRCLEQCAEAVGVSNAAVAFPIVEVFGDRSELLNVNLWSQSRFVEGNYIDAMALLRRAAVLEVGGYSVMQITGWEDFDLWCKLIEAGYQGVRVPEILARYRVHGASMLQTVTHAPNNVDMLKKEIRQRHPWVTYALPVSRLTVPRRKSPLWRRVVRALGHPQRSAHFLRARVRRWLARCRGRFPGNPSAVVERLVELGWFDPDFYLDTHADVASKGVDPTQHFLDRGVLEGRVALSPDQAEGLLRVAQQDATNAGWSDYLAAEDSTSRVGSAPLKVGVYASSRGNFYFTEIRDLLVEGLRRCGHEAQALDEESKRPATLTHDVVVAPHEFFLLGEGPGWDDGTFLNNAIMLNTEQLHTPWFLRSLPLLEQARVTLDINCQSAAALRYLGIPAHFLPLGYVPDYPPLEPRPRLPEVHALATLSTKLRTMDTRADMPFSERPVEIMYVSTLSPRRHMLLARHAAFFSRHRCFFHVSLPHYPLSAKSDGMNIMATSGVSRLSKILLNIHRDEFSYFEWHRMVFYGFWQKTLVVTEPCYEVPEFQPGVHYLSCEHRDMPSLVEWLLNTTEGRDKADKIRLQAYDTLSTQCVLRHHLRRLIDNVIRDIPGVA